MWLISLLFGCPSTPDDPADSAETCDPAVEPVCACEPVTLEIGDGEAVFTPVAPGQEVIMVHGPQGGWHVLASVYASGIGSLVRINYTIDTLPELTRVSDNAYNVMLAEWADCHGLYWNMFGYLDVAALAEGELDTPPELLAGRELRFSLEVTDTEGRGASAVIDLVGAADPGDLDTGI